MLITRKKFIKLCTQAILSTREKISIRNQLSGYKKFHQEIKENNYFSHNVRSPIKQTCKNEYMYRHALLEHVGLGNCHELADFLLVEIGREIERSDALARIRITGSIEVDHVYLEIRIRLKGEIAHSIWEVDAWNPRIIDISVRPDGSIKNYDALDYGYRVKIHNLVYTDEINYKQKYSFFKIPKPVPGCPPVDATPDMEMLEKHEDLYSDHNVDEAMETENLDSSGKIQYLQRVSTWQTSKSSVG